MKKIYVYALSLQIVLMASAALSQQTVMQGQGMPPGDNVIGKVTAATKDTITVTPMTGGDPVTVKVGGDTRVIKDRQMAGIGDIKIGDTVAARGPLKGQSMDALFVVIVDPSMIQQMIAGRPGNGPRAATVSPILMSPMPAIWRSLMTRVSPPTFTVTGSPPVIGVTVIVSLVAAVTLPMTLSPGGMPWPCITVCCESAALAIKTI